MLIRKYHKRDRKAVEDIHFRTGFFGDAMEPLLSKRSLWKEGICYYLKKEPQSAFVAVKGRRVVGYLLGCLDDSKTRESWHIAWHTAINLLRLPFMPQKDRRFWTSQIHTAFASFFGSDKQRLELPKAAGHLHINLLPEARGRGVGTKLVKTFCEYARSNGTRLIHAESYKTGQNTNRRFWVRNGFREYSQVKTNFWKSALPKEEVFFVCYVKVL